MGGKKKFGRGLHCMKDRTLNTRRGFLIEKVGESDDGMSKVVPSEKKLVYFRLPAKVLEEKRGGEENRKGKNCAQKNSL